MQSRGLAETRARENSNDKESERKQTGSEREREKEKKRTSWGKKKKNTAGFVRGKRSVLSCTQTLLITLHKSYP